MTHVVRVAHHPIAHAPTQQVVDRHTQRLAADVPQRLVDGRDGRRENALGGEEAAAEELLPDVLDALRGLPDEKRLEVLKRTHDGELAPGQAGLAHARDALIRIDHDEEEVAVPTPDGKCLDIADLHRALQNTW